MFGTGLLKGLGVTMKHFMETYIDDVKAIPSRYASGQDMIRQLPDEEGIFTIQYPEEKRLLPERFRYIPMLIHDTPRGEDRCTACGICAKVCPPQCIWIVRDQDEKGKPIPHAAEFYIDASICMSCGFCSEFCPFDAIKMNHDYELAVYERYPNLVYDIKELTVPLEYYAALYPAQFAEEEARRAEQETKKAAKSARRSGGDKPQPAAAKPTAAAAAAVAKAPAAPAKPAPPPPPPVKKEEVVQQKPAPKPAPPAEPKAEKPAPPAAAAAAAATATFGKPLSAKAHTSGKLSFEELERRRAEAYDRYKDRKGADAKILHLGAAAAKPAAKAEPAPAAPVSAAVETPQETQAPAAAVEPAAPAETKPAPATPAAAAETAAGGRKPWPATAHSSGTLSWDELERRRIEAHARYRERKGGDAKILSEYVK